MILEHTGGYTLIYNNKIDKAMEQLQFTQEQQHVLITAIIHIVV